MLELGTATNQTYHKNKKSNEGKGRKENRFEEEEEKEGFNRKIKNGCRCSSIISRSKITKR